MASIHDKKVAAQNRRARHEYFIEETYECGIALAGTEVKSIRLGKANLADSYAMIRNGEVFLCNMHVTPYEEGNVFNKDPLRDRKLLLHKREIMKLLGYVQQKGLSLVPLQIYFSGNKLKVELAVARGKKLYDKRESKAEADAKREMDRRMKERMAE